MRYYLLCLSVFLLQLFSASPISAADTVRIQLRWIHGFQFAGYYAAIAKGFYRDAGLEVTLLEGGVGIDTVKQVLQGSALYGVTNAELLLHRVQGDPVVVLAAIFQHSPHVFLSRSETGIRTPHDLIGKKVKMSKSERDIELHAMLKNEGVSLDQLTILEEQATPDDYLNPEIDAVAAYITDQSYYLEKARIPYHVIAPSMYGVDFYGDTLFTTEEETALHPERVKALTEASLRGWEYALAHPEEIADLLIAKYGCGKSRDHLLSEAGELQKLILPTLVELGHMNPGRWEHIGKTFVKNGILAPGYSLEGFIYNPTLGVDNKRIWRIVGPIIIAGLGLAALALFLLSFNKKLKRAVQEQTNTAEELRNSQQMLQMYAKQTEQFSLSAASILSIKDEKVLFAKISDAIVNYSDFSRVLISLFFDTAPYRELIGYAGVSEEIAEKVRKTELPKFWYDKVFEQGIKLGQASYYIPHTMKDILNQEATVYGEGNQPEHDEGWHPEDNLFVRMNDENGDFIGVISVDSAKSGLRPTNEIVRPLEIYASLISQIIILKRNNRLREELENQLRQAQKMEAIGNLTGGIAHDFNNILAIIIGNTELAQMMQENNESCLPYLLEIHQASHRARDIVRHLLAFSRKTINELTPLKIGTTLEESLAFLRSTLPTTITIEKHIALGEALVKANPTQIHQIMLNLCTNAVHAMEEDGGTLSIRATVVSFDAFQEIGAKTLPVGQYIEIQVSDNGHGIDPEVMHQIFDPYFTTKEVGKGTGMGLAIVHGIVQGHNGVVSVKSAPDTGSTFIVYLPLFAGVPQEETRPADAIRGGNERILLIDDDLSLLQTMGKRLQRLGYHVELTNSSLRALELFTSNPQGIDLVVTDMTMPEMTGDVLAVKLLAIRPELPIILCTGFSERIDSPRADNLGIRHYFEKPVVFHELATAIRNELAKVVTSL